MLDTTAPADARAVQVFVRQEPPRDGQTARRFAVDNIRLVQWAPQGAGGRGYDVVRAGADATARFVRDVPAVPGEQDGPVLRRVEADG
ncbi:hypothetical protein [Luteipulveratus halotolerans]|uniref:hypothetical protein n=1 Tax=Luteipulveratus halotolerans TaxID=1631356 RepID=UPI0012F8BEBE|nr:hypothetical protein [Luteipulveratus halotolerans]